MSNMRWWNEGMKLISAYDRSQNAACKHTNQLSFGNLVKFGIISNNGGPNKSIFHSLTETKTPRFQSEWHLQSPNSSSGFFRFKTNGDWVLCYFFFGSGIRDSVPQPPNVEDPSIFTIIRLGYQQLPRANKNLDGWKFRPHFFATPINTTPGQRLGRINRNIHFLLKKKSRKPSTMIFSTIKTQPDMIFPDIFCVEAFIGLEIFIFSMFFLRQNSLAGAFVNLLHVVSEAIEVG